MPQGICLIVRENWARYP